ncbi:MAG: hypothetical protein AAF297_03835, partial [Planctomycetota bacterium]
MTSTLQALTLAVGLAAGSAIAPAQADPPRKVILAHYMPWFETPDVRGFWGFHWSGFNNEADPDQIVGPDGRRDIWSNYYPLIDLYDSADPDVLECQLLQMKLAGIDGVLADWYGLSDAADYPIIHFATEALFDATAEFDMQFAVVFEDRTYDFRLNNGLLDPADVTADLTATFQWMQTNWFGAAHYAQDQGRPLLLNFGPIELQTPVPWGVALASLTPRPRLYSLASLWTTNSADGAFTWVQGSLFDDFPSSPLAQQRVLNFFNAPTTDVTRMIPSANPGFDDVYVTPPPGVPNGIPYRNGDTLRDMLTVAMDGDWPIVQLVTWNDYGEGTMIEPTREFGYQFLEIVQDARRDELGSAFTFTESDLRQPARLLAQRRAGLIADVTLDQISDLMRTGDPAAAAFALDLLEGFDPFVAQPSDTVVDAGGTLVVSAPGAVAPGGTLRWHRDSLPLVNDARVAGVNSDTLTITGASAADTGVYRLIASAAGLEAESADAVVGVRASALGRVDINADGVLDD